MRLPRRGLSLARRQQSDRDRNLLEKIGALEEFDFRVEFLLADFRAPLLRRLRFGAHDLFGTLVLDQNLHFRFVLRRECQHRGRRRGECDDDRQDSRPLVTEDRGCELA